MSKKQIHFEAYGVQISVFFESEFHYLILEKRLETMLPTGFRLLNFKIYEHIFEIKQEATGNYQLFRNKKNVANHFDETRFFDFVESELRITIAEFAVSRVFLHAGVVGWKGQAIIFPGDSFSGKTTLISELIKRGATYFSDEYAVLDKNAEVHPFPKMLSMRGIIDDFTQVDIPPEKFGANVGKNPIPVGLVIFLQFDVEMPANLNDSNRLQLEFLSPGNGVLEIIKQTIPIRNNPSFALKVLKKLVNRAKIAKGKRGDAQIYADLLIEYFENILSPDS